MEKTANDYYKVPTKELLKDPDAEVPPAYGYGVRHIQLVIFTICLSTSFIARGHLGVSIVAMTRTPNLEETLLTNLSDGVQGHSKNLVLENVSENINVSDIKSIELNYTKMKTNVNDAAKWNIETYNWSKSVQEMVLGSFFLGDTIMMFPMGMVCQRWGGKLPFQISLFINGIISFATPWLTMWGGWKAVCCCRIIQGLSQAGTYPSVQMLLANWVSSSERATLSSYLYTGTTFGNVIAFQIGGILAESRWGWPCTFWTVGAVCFVSFILLTVFGAATPKQHKSISQEEKYYILGRFSDEVVRNPRVPWKALLTSRPVWASFATHVGSGVAFVFFFTQVPSYIHYILGIDVKSSGILSSLPYMASFFTSIAFGIASDFCTNRNLVSVKNARRINNSIAQIGTAVSLMLTSFATSITGAITCLVLAMACQMGIHAGWMVNHIDLAPNFTGTIMSVGNVLMNIFVLLIPVFVSHIVTDVRDPHQWRVMFGIVGALAIACNAVFVIFLSTERQPWNDEVSDWGYRHQQCIILFFTLTIAYSMRSCMGVSLVAMTVHDYQAKENTTLNSTAGETGEEFKLEGILNILMLSPPYPKFKWSKKIQDTVIASFLWGYMIIQVPAGQMAHRFGTRYLLFGAMMINCVASILFPIVAYYGGWICTVIVRIIQGLSQACIIPGMHTFFGRWAPLNERGRLTALTYGGQALGTVLGLPMTGFIAASPLGWPGLFRFYGILSGIIGGILWWLIADTPGKHSKISAAERKYIEDGLGRKEGYENKRMAVPWSKILRCRGVYAIIVAHVGHTWGQLILYSEVPAFMDKVMGVNIKANGLLTALPFMVMWFTNFFFSWMTDMLIVKKILSVTNTRKLANTIGSVPVGIGLIILAYVPKNIYVVETLLVLICGVKIAGHMGFQVNHIDISPNFAGTLMSLSNFIANMISSIAPIIAGFILTDVTSEYLWRQVFFLAAGLYFATAIFYLVFGTAERAEWNNPEDEKRDSEEVLPMMKENENK
ncbi:uncharacterized protein LOC115442923 isoform X2 [Manduca sexta]|uniref:uncharacterized protein LOC115442923 isoform X2 n=1 Tax=Manduca sexta TaxID=7130 RepID=UPI00188E6CAA|nr:uncharacterized protein LOC115442923 isoform X2 [Manduca sexta]